MISRPMLPPALVFCLLSQPLGAATFPELRRGPADSVQMDAATLESAVELYARAVERDDLRGVVLLVARRGVVVMHEAIGWKHQAYRLKMEPDTLFRMASNTKPVVAAGLLIAAEEGKLDLQDRASKHLESYDNWRSRNITLAQLLSHTSGLRIGPIFYPFEDADAPHTLRSAVALFGAEGPAAEPGTSYSYNNAGYNSAGAALEVATGMPLEEYLKSRIYDPLGMKDSLNHEDPAKLNRMATVYRKRGGGEFRQGFTPGDPPDFPVIRASGGMISTAADYARFLQTFLNGGGYGAVRILKEASVRLAVTPHVQIPDSESSYGLGWRIDPNGVYRHSGSDGTMAWVDPSRELIGLVFTQSPGGANPVRRFKELVEQACDSASRR